MNKYKLKSTIRITAITIITVIAVCSLLITFAGGKSIPSWNEIYSSLGMNATDNGAQNYVSFLDVGQGDSILIHSKGRSALIDASTLSFGDIICDKLRANGIKSLDLMMLSHNHDDHYGGAERVVSRMMVDNLIMPDLMGSKSPTATITEIRNDVLADEGECFVAKQGMNVNIGDFTVTVLAHYKDEENENNRSIFAVAECQGVRFLFTGDAEDDVEKSLLKEGLDLKCDVLKVGHHGAKTSTSQKFIDATKPKYAVISVGEGNQYSHPHEATISRLYESGIDFYRTDIHGDVTFYINGGKMNIKTTK